MKLLLLFLLSSALSIVSSNATSTAIPTLEEIQSIIGKNSGSTEVSDFIQRYQFSENPKRSDSWGSSFGVMLEVDKQKRIFVIIRPPSSHLVGFAPYPGKLPDGIKAHNTPEDTEALLGHPLTSTPDKLVYDQMTFVFMDNELFEVILRATPKP